MKHQKFFVALMSAGAMLLFASAANAQPGPGHHGGPKHDGPAKHAGPNPGNFDHCDCVGRPGCPCDDYRGHAAPPSHHGPAVPPPQHGPAVPPPHHGPAVPPPPAKHHGPVIPPPHHRPLPPPPRGMEPHSFDRLMASINSQTFKSDKMIIVNNAIQTNEFNCDQVRAIMRSFTFDSDRINVASQLFYRVVDRENWYTVYNELTFSSSKQQLHSLTR